jgi:uncharacterized repeat protein (TIGR01451 family)
MPIAHATFTVRRSRLIVLSLALALLMLFTLINTIVAGALETATVDLEGSSKAVSDLTASAGATLDYTIVVDNSGDETASGVVMTDTLPSGLTYVPASLVVVGGSGTSGVENGVVSWSGDVSSGESISISYSAVVSASLPMGTLIKNTALITVNGASIERSASTTVLNNVTNLIYFPYFVRHHHVPTLMLVSSPDVNNQWTIGWAIASEENVSKYEVQEAKDRQFTNPIDFEIPSPTKALTRSHPVSTNNRFYYRVRAVSPTGIIGPWSDVLLVGGNYLDNFDNPESGWAVRREDTDDVEQFVFYENGRLIHRILGRWDSMLAAPMMPAPNAAYRLETRVKLSGVDNLHTYGLVFGGDWNGEECPNDDWDSCFNHYYRLLVIWYGASNKLRMSVKRIEWHDSGNVGRGTTIISSRDVTVNKPPRDWQNWAVEVRPNGSIRIFVNNNLVGATTDTTFSDDFHFGTFSSTNEYSGLKAEFDWVRATAIP